MAEPSSRVCRVLMTGPLTPFADAFAAELRARGYTPLTTAGELRQVGRLSCWLQAGGLSAADLTDADRLERDPLAVQAEAAGTDLVVVRLVGGAATALDVAGTWRKWSAHLWSTSGPNVRATCPVATASGSANLPNIVAVCRAESLIVVDRA